MNSFSPLVSQIPKRPIRSRCWHMVRHLSINKDRTHTTVSKNWATNLNSSWTFQKSHHRPKHGMWLFLNLLIVASVALSSNFIRVTPQGTYFLGKPTSRNQQWLQNNLLRTCATLNGNLHQPRTSLCHTLKLSILLHWAHLYPATRCCKSATSLQSTSLDKEGTTTH